MTQLLATICILLLKTKFVFAVICFLLITNILSSVQFCSEFELNYDKYGIL